MVFGQLVMPVQCCAEAPAAAAVVVAVKTADHDDFFHKSDTNLLTSSEMHCRDKQGLFSLGGGLANMLNMTGLPPLEKLHFLK